MMRFMALDYFARSPMLAFPLLALVIFMLVFGLVTLRALLKRQSSYEALASLPLESRAAREAEGEAHGT